MNLSFRVNQNTLDCFEKRRSVPEALQLSNYLSMFEDGSAGFLETVFHKCFQSARESSKSGVKSHLTHESKPFAIIFQRKLLFGPSIPAYIR